MTKTLTFTDEQIKTMLNAIYGYMEDTAMGARDAEIYCSGINVLDCALKDGMNESQIKEIDKKLGTKPSGKISSTAVCPKCKNYTFVVKSIDGYNNVSCCSCGEESRLWECWGDFEK